jgi:hypothetical protein
MADTRINALTTSSVSVTDDFLPIDGATAGTKKLSAFSPSFGGSVTVGQTLTTAGNATIGTGGNTNLLLGPTGGLYTHYIRSSTAGGAIQIQGDPSTGNRWLSLGRNDNVGVYAESLRVDSNGLITMPGTTGLTISTGITVASGAVGVGAPGTGGSFYVNTPSLNSSYSSGLGIDGSYPGGVGAQSVINIKAFGVMSGGGYGSTLSFQTTLNGNFNEVMRLTSGSVVQVLGTAASSSTITGALVVGSGGSGGLGVAGAIFAGGNLTNGEYHLTNGTSTHARSVYALSGTGKVEIGYGPTGYGFAHPTGSYIAYADTFYFGALGAASAALSLSAGGILSSSVGTGGVGTQLVLNNNSTNATSGRGSALVYTGTGDANLASIESQTATASNNTGKLVIKTSNAGTLAIAATYDENGNLIQKVNGTAPSLAVNSTMTFELTSNTSLKIFVRGSDGTTRSTTLTLA